MARRKNAGARIASTSMVLSCYPIHEAVELLAELGYGAIAIEAAHLEEQLDERLTSLEDIRAATLATGIEAVVHAHLRCPETGRAFNLCSEDEDFRMESLLAYCDAMELAEMIGARIVTIHPGFVESPDKYPDEEYLKRQFDAFFSLAVVAEDCRLKIGIEMMEDKPGQFTTEPEDVLSIINVIDSEALGVTLDLTHSYTFGEEKMLEHIETLGEDIIHVHTSGYSEKKTHVPLYMTEMPAEVLDEALGKLRESYSGIVVIEGHTHRLREQTPEHQREIVERNMEYMKENLPSLNAPS